MSLIPLLLYFLIRHETPLLNLQCDKHLPHKLTMLASVTFQLWLPPCLQLFLYLCHLLFFSISI